MDRLTFAILRQLSPDKQYLSYYDVCLTVEDVKMLKNDWLTDNNIAFWEEYLERETLSRYPQAHIVLLRPSMTFLLMKEPELKAVKAALPDFNKVTHVFLPINDNTNPSLPEGGSHWSLLLISVLDGLAFHYDSMGGVNVQEAHYATRKFGDIMGRRFRFINLDDTPQQENGSDCGVFVCLLMRHLLVKRLLSANAREKVSMSMSGKMVDSSGGRKEMLRIIENLLTKFGLLLMNIENERQEAKMQRRKPKLEQARLKKRISPTRRKCIMFHPFKKSSRNRKGMAKLASKDSNSGSKGYLGGTDRIDRATWRKQRRDARAERVLGTLAARCVTTRSSTRRSSRHSTEQLSPKGTRDKAALYGDSPSPTRKRPAKKIVTTASKGAVKPTTTKKTAAKSTKSATPAQKTGTKQTPNKTATKAPAKAPAKRGGATKTTPTKSTAKTAAMAEGFPSSTAQPLVDQRPASSPARPSAKRSADSDDLNGQGTKRARRTSC
ncbi:Ulp1 protease family protein [Purpureocillium lavendulum]|uniref:Ulp1 protease family protein n=1 Tax=Purpureocillium lavendulum TaxID=1247861 RepID=A0AB34G208_9HYPO|nr:Ulp1 protease family protein [Purpureocillium lavendulum]